MLQNGIWNGRGRAMLEKKNHNPVKLSNKTYSQLFKCRKLKWATTTEAKEKKEKRKTMNVIHWRFLRPTSRARIEWNLSLIYKPFDDVYFSYLKKCSSKDFRKYLSKPVGLHSLRLSLSVVKIKNIIPIFGIEKTKILSCVWMAS